MSDGRAACARWLARLYGLALLLYPEAIRREYAHEMQAVFSLKANDAAQRSGFMLVRLACREARDLPGAIVRTHLNERNAKMKLVVGDPVYVDSMNAWKIASVFLPFVLALLLSVRNMMSGTFFAVLGLTLFGLLVVIWIAGLATALPVWALPSLGMLLFFFYFYILKLIVQAIVYVVVLHPLFGGWPKDLALGIPMLLLVSIGTILVMAGALLVLLLLPKFRDRIRQDWTLLSFFLYGMATMPMFMNDEFHHLWGYQLASLLLLAAGAGLYLKAPRRWQRILALVIPAVLSQAILILGLYQTYPMESWINLADPGQRIWESVQPLSDPLPVLLLLPALSLLIPWRGKPEPVLSRVPTMPPED